MKVELTRVCSSDNGTFGVLSINNEPICVTCEDPWKDNSPNISCIPIGNYQCVKFSGTKYKDVWEVTNVPGRSAILIHNGNTIKDTQGCILVGLLFTKIKGTPAVGNSLLALDKLRYLLPDKFTLVIK